MQVNGFGFITASYTFNGALEYRAATAVFTEVVDEVDFDKVGVGGQPFVDMIVQQNVVLCIFQFDFINHGF